MVAKDGARDRAEVEVKRAKRTKGDVLARYGNWYKGADDLFAHCLILSGGDCVLLFQGLSVVTTKQVSAPAAKHAALVKALKQRVPPDWQKAAYSGFNFITDAEGATASEIAVLGQQAADTYAQYYAAPADSDIGQLVKAIAKLD